MCLPLYLLRIAVMRELFNVMHQAEQLPLHIDFDASTQREAVQALVVPQLAEDRFHDRKTPAVESAALRRIDPLFHRLGMAQWRCLRLVEDLI